MQTVQRCLGHGAWGYACYPSTCWTPDYAQVFWSNQPLFSCFAAVHLSSAASVACTEGCFLLQLGTNLSFQNWGCVLFAYFDANITDNYTFNVGSDNGAELFMDSQLLVNNSGKFWP